MEVNAKNWDIWVFCWLLGIVDETDAVDIAKKAFVVVKNSNFAYDILIHLEISESARF